VPRESREVDFVKKLVCLLIFAALVGGLNAVMAESASASDSVTVKKIPGKTARYKHKATIRPKVTHHGHIANLSKTVTVKKGKKTVGKNRKLIALKAGTYSVKTTARYRTYKWVDKPTTKNVLAYEDGDTVPVTCVVQDVTDPSNTSSAYTSSCVGNFTGSIAESGTAQLTDMSTYRWALAGDEASSIVAGTTADTLLKSRYDTSVVTDKDLYRSEAGTTREKSFSGTKVKTRGQKLRIKQGKKPGSTEPDGWDCPSWAPIKGNESSHIYHMPSGAFYDRTNPEICFSSQGAARHAGYRKSKR
jgi:hypothetical protein